MDWFKLYHEFSTDPKVQSMPEHMQRRLVMIFCLRCNETLETLRETELCFALRISETELEETKQLFLSKGFIDETWDPVSFAKRNEKLKSGSKSSTERVRRYRDKKKCNDVTPDETLHETHVTDETPLDKIREDKNRKEDNKKNKQKKVSLDELSIKHISDWLVDKRKEGFYLKHNPAQVLEGFKNYCLANGKTYKDYPAALRNAFGWEQFKPKGSADTFKPEAQQVSNKQKWKNIHWNIRRKRFVDSTDMSFYKRYKPQFDGVGP